MTSFRKRLWPIKIHFSISSKDGPHEHGFIVFNFQQILSYLQIPWYCIHNKYFSRFCIDIMYVLLWLENFLQFSKPIQSAAIQFLLKINYNESMLWRPFLELIMKCILMLQSKCQNEYSWLNKVSTFFKSKEVLLSVK